MLHNGCRIRADMVSWSILYLAERKQRPLSPPLDLELCRHALVILAGALDVDQEVHVIAFAGDADMHRVLLLELA